MALVQIAFYLAGTGSHAGDPDAPGGDAALGPAGRADPGAEDAGAGSASRRWCWSAAFLCSLGSYSAWFGVGARLPFAAGIDAYLPAAFGRRDPRSGAPVVSIAVQTVIVAVIVVISQAGDTLKAPYDFLVAMTVLSYTLPFLFLFAVFLAAQRRAPRRRTPGARPAGAAWRWRSARWA